MSQSTLQASGTRLAQRLQRIATSPSSVAVQKVRDLRAQGRQVWDLTVGEPDFDTPENVKAAAVRAIAEGRTKYTPVNGIPQLRTAVADRIAARTGVAHDPAHVTVGGGAKQVIFLALSATVDHGDEVLIPAPYWVSYPDMVKANDGTPVIVPTRAADGFKLTAAALREAITPATRWLILNTPGNPTGAAYSAGELRALADVLAEHPHVLVLTDEIYDEVWFEAEPASNLLAVAPELAERVLLTNGVSKTYAMTGWRIGWAAGPAELIAAINTLQSQTSSCPSSISQWAAVEALTGDQSFVERTAAVYRERRDAVVAAVRSIEGLSCLVPSGGFYAFVSCQDVLGKRTADGQVIATDEQFAALLLDSEQVAVIHGAAYGAPGWFRVSFATSQEVIDEALARLARVVEALS
ncbi:aminotransferase class I/II-fold pyridoxal phosphate-dependent enzyme [Kineococcus sp. G2]|uniref:aminotransferase class I/II-fold pyridoxal phosphate-dependent enzyme n=1 Tax=Kineococcus sp. G2 TaxID=3127484 RepID=UPI00301BC13E